MPGPLHLTLERGTVGVARLAPDGAVPAWLEAEAPLRSLVWTADELSVITAWDAIPDEVRKDGPWAVLAVTGPLDFSLVGVVAALSKVLADAGLSIFVVSTYDTDYLLVHADQADEAVGALVAAGHLVSRQRPG